MNFQADIVQAREKGERANNNVVVKNRLLDPYECLVKYSICHMFWHLRW